MKVLLEFPREDLTGRVFSKITVLKFNKYVVDSKGRRKPEWLIQCECGVVRNMNQGQIKNQQSCGCLLSEYRRNKLPELTAHRNRIEYGLASFNNLYSNYKNRAKKINIDFFLSKIEFKELVSKNCFYCNIPAKQVFHRKFYYGDYIYNGLDRVDNSIGYIKENVVPCCEICNKAKRDLKLDNFINWIEQISNYARKISFNYKTTD